MTQAPFPLFTTLQTAIAVKISNHLLRGTIPPFKYNACLKNTDYVQHALSLPIQPSRRSRRSVACRPPTPAIKPSACCRRDSGTKPGNAPFPQPVSGQNERHCRQLALQFACCTGLAADARSAAGHSGPQPVFHRSHALAVTGSVWQQTAATRRPTDRKPSRTERLSLQRRTGRLPTCRPAGRYFRPILSLPPRLD